MRFEIRWPLSRPESFGPFDDGKSSATSPNWPGWAASAGSRWRAWDGRRPIPLWAGSAPRHRPRSSLKVACSWRSFPRFLLTGTTPQHPTATTRVPDPQTAAARPLAGSRGPRPRYSKALRPRERARELSRPAQNARGRRSAEALPPRRLTPFVVDAKLPAGIMTEVSATRLYLGNLPRNGASLESSRFITETSTDATHQPPRPMSRLTLRPMARERSPRSS